MDTVKASETLSHSIGAVERDTGVPKDTLRIWERRYGFPHPQRDIYGERQFSTEQVEKLRLIKRLLDRGHRPRKIIPLDIAELIRLAEVSVSDNTESDKGEVRADLSQYIELCKTHQVEELRRTLSQALARMGL